MFFHLILLTSVRISTSVLHSFFHECYIKNNIFTTKQEFFLNFLFRWNIGRFCCEKEWKLHFLGCFVPPRIAIQTFFLRWTDNYFFTQKVMMFLLKKWQKKKKFQLERFAALAPLWPKNFAHIPISYFLPSDSPCVQLHNQKLFRPDAFLNSSYTLITVSVLNAFIIVIRNVFRAWMIDCIKSYAIITHVDFYWL